MPLIFISYASEDDRKFGNGGSRGWVTAFDEALKLELRAGLQIWRDKHDLDLPGSIADTLSAEIGNADYLLPVLSSYYGVKQYTRLEVAAFFRILTAKALRPVDFVVPVMPRPIRDEDIPDYFSDARRIAFFETDADGKVVPYFDGFGAEISPKYFGAIREVVSLIEQRINTARPAQAPKATVYLARAALDQIDSHWNVKNELVSRNCRVLPTTPWPVNAPDARTFLSKALSVAQFSIHLLGAMSDQGSGLTELSTLELDLAAERQKQDKTFRRLIWIPPGIAVTNDAQRHLIESLDDGSRLTERDELVRGGIESFKEIIHDELTQSAVQAGPPQGLHS